MKRLHAYDEFEHFQVEALRNNNEFVFVGSKAALQDSFKDEQMRNLPGKYYELSSTNKQ